MKRNWIVRNHNSRLIMFFNGWGMDENAVSRLKIENCDLIEFYDYRTLDFDASEYDSYSEIYVVAWSLGVWVASRGLNGNSLPVQKSVAINGTVNPVDASEGIPPEIFKGTLDGWNEKNRERFQMRMAGGRREFTSRASRFGERSVDNQKEELEAIWNHIQQSSSSDFQFDFAIIGERDVIFSCQNQMNFWQNKCDYEVLDLPHYPFAHFTGWKEILDGVTQQTL